MIEVRETDANERIQEFESMDITRRRVLASFGTGGSLLIAGCLFECGPGRDEFRDVKERIDDGELDGNKDHVEVSFRGEVISASAYSIILDDTTATASIVPPAGSTHDASDVSNGDCMDGTGRAYIEDNEDLERLVIQSDL